MFDLQASNHRRNSRTEFVRRSPIRTVSNSGTTPRLQQSHLSRWHIMMIAGFAASILFASYYWMFSWAMSAKRASFKSNLRAEAGTNIDSTASASLASSSDPTPPTTIPAQTSTTTSAKTVTANPT